MAGVQDSLERLKAALSAANTQALERERLRLADIGRIQEALLDLLGALVSGGSSPPLPVVIPSAGMAAGATVTQAAALISGAATAPVKPPKPSVDGRDFSSDKLEFSNGLIRWATAIAAINPSFAEQRPQ